MNTSLLAAFRNRTFATLWFATFVSNIGSWMYGAAAGWLMTSLTKDAFLVSLVQVASSAPVFLLALVAGALSDIVDRRRLLIWGESIIALLSAVFATVVWMNRVTPASLLWFMFLISVSGALVLPTWQAVVPRLVPREQLSSAISANGVSFNLSRAIGPVLAGAIIGPLGIAAPFIVNAVSNFGVIGVLAAWREPAKNIGALPSERFISAIGIGLRYAVNNMALRDTFVRTSAFFVFSSAFWALLPLVARLRISGGPETYGVLLGAIGVGAVAGAFAMPYFTGRFGANRVVAMSTVGTSVALVLLAIAREPILALSASVLVGAAWIGGVMTLNVSAQRALPDWVRGRGLAMYMTVMFGSLTLGSALWGALATAANVQIALLVAAVTLVVALAFVSHFKLRSGDAPDLTPSTQWPAPVLSRSIEPSDGPVLVTVEYDLAKAEDRIAFLELLEQLQHERLRDGASFWGLFEDTSQAGRFLETFVVASWIEHLRQHERITNDDYDLQMRLNVLLKAEPAVRHLVSPNAS